MGVDIAVYKTKLVSEDQSTCTALLERTELLDTKSAELGEALVLATEAPNGCTTTVDPYVVLDVLNDYISRNEFEYAGMKEQIEECISDVKSAIDEKETTVSVNVWW